MKKFITLSLLLASPDMQLNEVLWYGLKGEAVALSAPIRAAFVKWEPKEEEED
jgi:hypothetical protein